MASATDTWCPPLTPKTKDRHHHHRARIRGFGYFRRLGPGLITGAADDDPSGIGTYSQVGAAFRFGMLWTTLFALPVAAAVQETAGRLGLASGKGLATLIKEHFPRWVLVLTVSLVTVANTFNIGADLGSMGAALGLVVPVPGGLLVVALAAVIVVLEIIVSYRRYARILRWLTLSLGAYFAVLATVRVPWGEVARSTLRPSLPGGREGIAALIAILGTTISPYLFFWQASEEVEEEEAGRVPVPPNDAEVRAMRVDVTAGMFSAVAVMFSIMVASAVTLGAEGITTVQTADQAARALEPIAGRAAGLLFALGILGTGLLAVPVLAGSSAYAVAEAVGWREGLSRRFREAHGFYGAIVVAVAIGVALDFSGINPIRALYFAAILNGLAAPPLILLMLILSNARGAVGRRTGGRISDVLVGLAFLVMAGLPVAYLVS